MTLAEIQAAIERCDREIQNCVAAQLTVPVQDRWMPANGELDWIIARQLLMEDLAESKSHIAEALCSWL